VNQRRWIEPRFAVITAGIVAVILYGSLFPFHFHESPHPFRTLMESVHEHATRIDIVTNVLLYIPLGLFAAQCVRRPGSVWRVGLITLFGAMLSCGIELAQSYDAGRITNLSDVYSNTTGTLLGALLGMQFPKLLDVPFLGRIERRPFVILLLVSWLGYWLFPYVPRLAPTDYLDVLRPIVLASHLSPRELYEQLAAWLAVALLLQSLVGITRSRIAFGWVVFLSLFARGWIVGAVLSPEQALSGILAVLMWAAFLWRWRARAGWIAVLFAIHVALEALRPFQFSPHAHRFSLVPFRSFLEASRASAMYSFFNKTFTYGVLIWSMVRAGWPLKNATVLAAGLVFILRIIQIYLPGRSSEITDTIMVLALAGLMKLVAENPAQTDPHAGGKAMNRYPTPRTVSR
jgi:VanZ family protein